MKDMEKRYVKIIRKPYREEYAGIGRTIKNLET